MSEKKYYVVGATTPEAWEHVNAVLTQDGTTDDNFPSRPVVCTDLKEHSPTRAVYLLTDAEAEQLSHCADIKFVQLDMSKYPESFPPNPDELHCSTRYNNTVKNYWSLTGLNIPQNPTIADANRAGYQLLRSAQYSNPWQGQSSTVVINDTIPNTNTGKNIDVIVGDDGCWFGHVEFQNNPTGGVAMPRDYVGGNKLPGNGTCDLLDVVLEGPYYIDPDWFNADPINRLTTRWDGTTVPVESVARSWWSTASQRSAQFAGAGTVDVPSYYTRANCNGTNTAISAEGDHGTCCAGQAYGRTAGWAYNANKWFINAYGNFGLWPVDRYFDVMKIFHENKPINPLYGTRDPTISSNSWGFRAIVPNTGYYYFRQGTSGASGVAYSNKPEFMRYIGTVGDSNRCKGEMLPNNLTTAGEELIDSGVIFVAAAGNSNQKQVSSVSADYNNYWSTNADTPLINATHNEFGSVCLNTVNRRGFPQQLGKFIDDEGNAVYPTINIGSLNDDYNAAGTKECKVNYSDMGNEIDCYAPGDGTLAPNRGYRNFLCPRYDTYAGSNVTSGYSGVCNTTTRITELNTTANTGNRIISIGSQEASVVNIPNSLLGPAGLAVINGPTSGNPDDGFWTLPLPFTIVYLQNTYNQVFIGTNGYITFQSGSTEWLNLNASNPPLNKIMINAEDNSGQRIYYGTEGVAPNRTYRVRFEGTNARSGITGSPNMVWEATFYESVPTQIDIQIGVNARQPGVYRFFDTRFGGTSSACPSATGLIATVLENNRSWGWSQIRTWIQSLNVQPDATFYQGPEPDTAQSPLWSDLESLMGGTRTVIYNTVPPTNQASASGSGLSINGSGLSITFN